MIQEQIERIILVEVLDFKKPERAGEHCRGLARNAARKILELPLGDIMEAERNVKSHNDNPNWQKSRQERIAEIVEKEPGPLSKGADFATWWERGFPR
jgi:hypothetical protein